MALVLKMLCLAGGLLVGTIITMLKLAEPNNDDVNDVFNFGEYGMDNVEVYIYNRWGQEVYSWTGENKAWDGRGADGQGLPEGVYFFVFKADGIDGHYYEEKGSITLLR